MKRNRPQSPATFEPIEQRTFFSFTAAPISPIISPIISTEITASLVPTVQISEHEMFPSTVPGFIQMPFMHQLHGPSAQTVAPPTDTTAPDTGTTNTETSDTDSTTTTAPSGATDSQPVTQSIVVNASLSKTVITDSSPLNVAASESFVTEWAIATEPAPTTVSQSTSIVIDSQQPTANDGTYDFFAAATAQPNQDDSNDVQALLAYLRQNKSEEFDTGMFSRERLPALQEISAGMHSEIPSSPLDFGELSRAAASQIKPASSSQTLLAQSPTQSLLESLTPNWWVWAGSLIVFAAQRLSSKQRDKEKPKNQFEFLSADWQPEQFDPKE